MKHIALIKQFGYYYIESDELMSEEFNDDPESGFYKEMVALYKKYDMEVLEGYTSFYGVEKYSICHCEKCNRLIVNRDENPTGIPGTEEEIGFLINNGGNHEGKVLCDMCLPSTHRWSYG